MQSPLPFIQKLATKLELLNFLLLCSIVLFP